MILKEREKFVLRKAGTSEEVNEALRQGRKLVFVDRDMDVPDGYMLLTVNYKGQEVKAVVPEMLLSYMANPGEGNPDEALDEIADFYGDSKDYEDEAIGAGETSVQKADITTSARNAYEVYLINKLTKDGKNFNQEEIERLGLDDREVKERVRGIAAICLGKQTEKELKKANLDELLDHKTEVNYGVEGLVNVEEEYLVKCEVGSHYELRKKYRTVQKKGIVNKTVSSASMDRKIEQLESEIENHRRNRGYKIERHDRVLIRQYANLVYIAKENPAAQLDVQPAEKEEKKDKEEK